MPLWEFAMLKNRMDIFSQTTIRGNQCFETVSYVLHVWSIETPVNIIYIFQRTHIGDKMRWCSYLDLRINNKIVGESLPNFPTILFYAHCDCLHRAILLPLFPSNERKNDLLTNRTAMCTKESKMNYKFDGSKVYFTSDPLCIIRMSLTFAIWWGSG